MATTTEGTMAPGPLTKVQTFLYEIRRELEKVTWPTVEDLKVSTKVCLMLLIGMSIIIGAFDRIFNWAVMLLLSLGK